VQSSTQVSEGCALGTGDGRIRQANSSVRMFSPKVHVLRLNPIVREPC